jgi:cell division protein FtsN
MTSQNLSPALARQRGGTFLGFVIGAVFGLALALGVAVYITKVPIPFMNKNQPRLAEGGAAEAQKNKDWDPNAALPGRLPPKPQPSASETTEPLSSGGAPAAEPAGSAGGSAGGAAAQSRDPLGDLARSRSETPRPSVAAEAPKASPAPAAPVAPPAAKASPAPPAPAAPAPPAKAAAAEPPAAAMDPLQYFVQAGAFRGVEEAEQMRARLSLMGLQARVSEREQAGRVVYRVRLGPFDRREDAEKAGERLEAAGVSAVLVRVQR